MTSGTPSPSASPRTRPGILSFLLPVFLGLVLILSLTPLLLFRTETGLRTLEYGLNRLLGGNEDLSVHIQDLDGSLPFDIRIGSLTIRDTGGAFFEGRKLHLLLSATDLFAGRIGVLRLTAGTLSLTRLPTLKEETPPPETEKNFSLPSLPSFFIRHLGVEEILLGEALTGEAMRLTLLGNAAADSDGVTARLDLKSITGPPLSLDLEARLLPRKENLHLALRLKDPGGRLPARFGLPEQAIELSLKGEGNPEDWNGAFALHLGEETALTATLSLFLGDTQTLRLNGDFRIQPDMLPAPLSFLLEKGRFSANILRESEGRLRLTGLHLHHDNLSLEGSAALTPATLDTEALLTLHLHQTEALARWLGVDPGPEVRIRLQAKGPVTGPRTRFDLRLEKASAGPLAFKGLGLDGELHFVPEPGALPELRCTARIRGEGGVFPGIPLPHLLEAEARLSYALSSHLLRLENLAIRGKDLDLEGSGHLYALTGDVGTHLDLRLGNLSPWLMPLGLDASGGKGGLTARMQGNLYDLNLHFGLEARTSALHGLPAPLETLGGDALRLQSRLTMGGPDGEEGLHLDLSDLLLEGAALRITGEGHFSTASQRLAGKLKLHFPQLRLLHEKLNGAADLTLLAQGHPAKMTLSAALSSEDLGLRPSHPFPLQLSLQAETQAATLQGKLDLTAGSGPLRLDGNTRILLGEKDLRLTGLILDAPGISLAGQADLDFENLNVRAELDGQVTDPGPLGRLAGMDVRGTGNFRLRLAPLPEGQDLTLNLQINPSSLGSLQLGGLRLEGGVHDLFRKPELDLALSLTRLRAADFLLEEGKARIHGSRHRMLLKGRFAGQALEPFDLSLQLRYAAQNAANHLHLDTLQGQWNRSAILLSRPWSLVLEKGRLSSNVLELELDKGHLRLEGGVSPETADMRLELRDFPLRVLGMRMEGHADAALRLEGPLAAPNLTLQAQGRGLCPQAPEDRHLPIMGLAITAGLGEGALSLETSVHSMETGESLLKARGRLPMAFSLLPFALVPDRNGPMEATLAGLLDLKRLGLLFMPPSQVLQGLAHLDLSLGGSLDAPRPSGTLTLEDGAYQHLGLGLNIQNIAATLELHPERIQIHSLSASDGNGGLIQGVGEVRLLPEDHFPFTLSLDAERFRAMHNDILMASLAKGRAILSGSLEKQHIAGDLRFDRLEIFLGEFGGPEVAELAVTEIHGPENTQNGNGRHRDEGSLTLDLDLHFPARIFVRGRGLDSEWGGSLSVSSHAANPLIRGDIRLIRGRMDFLGKRLTLSQGSVMLDGRQPPSPFVSVEARQEGKEVLCILKVEGQPPDLDFTLSSQPALPQDEVLAQMLFGRSLATITPVQAAQLALAARELGGGGGPGALGMARNLLGLDDLNIVSDGDANDDIRLRAGKYVHDRVYLRIEKDLKTNDDLVSADVELSRRITLESKVGPKGGGMGLFWKRDY